MRKLFLSLLLCAASVVPVHADWQRELEFRFRNGDTVEIGVFQTGKDKAVLMNGPATLDGSGMAKLANGKSVKIGYGNIKSAMAKIEEGYRTGRDLSGLNVEAQILRHNGRAIITLLGEVKNPGHGEFKDGMSLADVVAQAGGFTEAAYKKRVGVLRAGILTYVDCRNEQAAKDYKLQAGDVVNVDIAALQL